MQILVYTRDHPRYTEALRLVAPDADIRGAATLAEAQPHLEGTEILFAWGLEPDAIARMPRLRWIQWLGAGVDLVLPGLPDSVTLTRVVGAFSTVMAEHVFAYLLALRRGVFEMRALQEAHVWRRLTGRSLQGQRLGVAGLGSIGGEIVRVGRTFGMEIWGLSRSLHSAEICDRHFLPKEMRQFAAGVDALVLVLPKTAETDGIVDRAVLRGMREGSILINIGRGNAVVESDLAQALAEGRPAMAQLDVFEREPLPAESPLWDLPNCFISAHSSGPSEPHLVRTFAAANLERFLRGGELVGVVDPQRGY